MRDAAAACVARRRRRVRRGGSDAWSATASVMVMAPLLRLHALRVLLLFRAADFRSATAPLASRKHLLLDRSVVRSATGARLMPGEATKYPGNPLLSDAGPEREPWEVRYDNMQPNVFLDNGTFKLWYSSSLTCQASNDTRGTKDDACGTKGYWPCSGVVAPKIGPKGRLWALMYAESKDGIEWTKPALGVVSDSSTTQNRSEFAANNIVLLGTDGCGIMVDNHGPAAQRYKLFGQLDPGSQQRACPTGGYTCNTKAFAASADGIHWPPAAFGGKASLLAAHGTANSLVYDPVTQRYFGFGREFSATHHQPHRLRTETVARSVGPEFLGAWEDAVPCGLQKDEDKE